MDKDLATDKKAELVRLLRSTGSLLVAFSGGVDSTFLLTVAHETLGGGTVATTATSEIHPAREREAAKAFAEKRGIEHIVFRSEEISLPAFVSNGSDRCYHCKSSLFQRLANIAQDTGIKHIAHGANVDDHKDYRPGFSAAREMGIIAPLVDVALTKDEIRFLSKEMGLSTWDKPAMACLATRIPYGSTVTAEKLRMVEEAEAFLHENGIQQCRVRHHGPVARIEVVAPWLETIMAHDFRKAITGKFREIGFFHVAADLEGYTSGSMNRTLKMDARPEETVDARESDLK